MDQLPEKETVPAAEARPVALRISLWLGLVGGVLILVGLAGDIEGAAVAGTAAGTVSLVAVLVWRSQLIEAWRQQKVSASPAPAPAPPRSESP